MTYSQKNRTINTIILLLCSAFAMSTQAATYTLTSGIYPPCSTSWSVSGTTYTCIGNGRVTLGNNDILTANKSITIVAANGFTIARNNTIGSSTNRISLQSTYGTFTTTSGTSATSIFGDITSTSGGITLNNNVALTGTITSNAAISLTGGSVTGLVQSTGNTITTNGTNLSSGATAQSGLSITGGTIAGAFTLTSNNAATFTNVTMNSGSISGASTVSFNNSTMGTAPSPITVSSNSGAISLTSSTVFGDLTAPSYSTVNVPSGSSVTGTCLPNSTPANACTAPVCTTGLIGGLSGDFFNNTTLTNPVTATRIDNSVNFNWGAGSPGVAGIGTDNFSVRWTGSLRAPATGAYKFQTVSDDGVRLWINNVLVIDNWTLHSSTTDTSGTVNLTAGQSYPVKLEYYENGGDSVIALNWSLPGSTSFAAIGTRTGVSPDYSSFCSVPTTTCTSGLMGGATGKYYNNTTLTGSPASTRVDTNIDFNWSTGSPGAAGIGVDGFSIHWNATLKVPTTGTYQFQTNSDDGVRVWVNGTQVINNWTDHSATLNTSGNVTLTAGVNYPVIVEFYENGGDAVISLQWKGPADSAFSIVNGCPSTVSSYGISHSGTGITCAAEPITFSAYDGTGALVAPTAGTQVALSTVPATGVWAGGNIYTFAGTETSFIKYLQQTTPTTLNINVSDGSYGESGALDPSITFVDSALKFYGSNGLIAMQNEVADITDNAPILKAIRTDTVTGACVAQAAGSRTVKMAYVCRNPATCIAGQAFTVNGTAIQANSNANLASPTYSNVTLNFDAVTGAASIPINYPDVGQLRLFAQLALPAAGNDPAITLSGSSNDFVVKPNTLAISAVQTTGGGANPATTNSGTGFVAAGTPFSVYIEARNASGLRTPNFGNETVSEKDKMIVSLNSLVYPVGGTATPISGGGVNSFSATATAGAFVNNNVLWEQVGSFTLKPSLSDADYLGAGDVAVAPTTSGTIGRFYPDHFTLASATLANACTSFSYMNQPLSLSYQMLAKSLNNVTVTNYNKANYAVTNPSLVAENNNNGVDLTSRFNPGVVATATNWVNGVFGVVNSSASFNREPVQSAPDGPYDHTQVGIKMTDALDSRSLQGFDMNVLTTGVCSGAGCTAKMIGSELNMRYGRLRLDDAFGPETVPLPVNFATEYWTGNYFALNTSDSCTVIARNAITYPGGTLSTDSNRTVPLTGGSTQGFYTGLGVSGVQFTAGLPGVPDANKLTHYFSAPTLGAQGSFSVTVDLNATPWLLYDWDQNGTYSDATKLLKANFNFGSYRGNDRIIYWREKLQ